MASDARVNNEPGFVLHTSPFKETSVVAELFTPDYGRIAVIARGARRPASALRGLVQPFTPLLLSWFGKAELKTLHGAEWSGGLPALQGRALMCGFYLNELLLRLLARNDPHAALFDTYRRALVALGDARDIYGFESILRRFEKALLAEIGYAPTFDVEAASGRRVDAAARYTFQPERGPAPAAAGHEGIAVSGKTLVDLASGRFDDRATLAQAKPLMRALIDHYLAGKPLYTRRLLRELTEL